jgi:hypothetical protein
MHCFVSLAAPLTAVWCVVCGVYGVCGVVCVDLCGRTGVAGRTGRQASETFSTRTDLKWIKLLTKLIHGRQASETCSTRYARLGLCAPDAHTQVCRCPISFSRPPRPSQSLPSPAPSPPPLSFFLHRSYSLSLSRAPSWPARFGVFRETTKYHTYIPSSHL